MSIVSKYEDSSTSQLAANSSPVYDKWISQPPQDLDETKGKINDSNQENTQDQSQMEKSTPPMSDQFSSDEKKYLAFQTDDIKEVIIGPSLLDYIPPMCKPDYGINKFNIYEYNPSEFNKEGEILLNCEEKSSWCQKNLT